METPPKQTFKYGWDEDECFLKKNFLLFYVELKTNKIT